MTTRDANKIAAAMRGVRPLNWEDIVARTQYILSCHALSRMLAASIVGFDSAQFLRDCGAA